MADNDVILSPKGAEFFFAGKMRKMIFRNRGVIYLKEKHGGFIKAINAMDDINKEPDLDGIADVIYAGYLTKEKPLLTREDILESLMDMTFAETRELTSKHVTAAILGYYPEPKKEVEATATP